MAPEGQACRSVPPILPKFAEIQGDFASRKVDVRSGPAVVYLESVRGCPFSCIMCKKRPTKPRPISRELLERIEPCFPGLEVLCVHGAGEPLLADLDYFVHQSVKNDFVLHMNTTGFALTDDLADLLLKTRLSIRFSVHAGRPETFYRIMGVQLSDVQRKILSLVERSKSSPKSYDFGMSFIVMKENLHEIADFLQLAHHCGIRSVRFMRLSPNSESLRGVTVRGLRFMYSEQSSTKVRREFLARLPSYKALAAEFGTRIEFGSAEGDGVGFKMGELANRVSDRLLGRRLFPLVRQEGICVAPWFGQLVIDVDGEVNLCCATRYRLGSLWESPLSDIWRGQEINEIRRSFHEGRFPRACGYCRGFGFGNYPNNSFRDIER